MLQYVYKNVSSVSYVCCKCFIYMLYMYHAYVASACYKCFSCFRRILHLFHVECFVFQRYVRRGTWILACVREMEHAQAVPAWLLPRQHSRQLARTRHAEARNGLRSKKARSCSRNAVRTEVVSFPTATSRAVIWHVPRETELQIRAGGARYTMQARAS